jgi:hypothetical protein
MSTRPTVCVLAVLVLLSGCKDREIASYRAPKDPVASSVPATTTSENTNDLPKDHPPIGAGSSGSAPAFSGSATADQMANTAVPTGADTIQWSAPASWVSMPQRPMRKATYAIKGPDGTEADLSITSFPGDTGGLLANINRWRGQISVAPITESQLDAHVEHLDVGPLHIDVVDFVGTLNGAPTRVLGAIVPHQGDTWFFKVTGPDALVAREKAAFMAFVKTIQPR